MAVRKALGPYRSSPKTESGRGYRLLGDWAAQRHVAAKPPVGVQRMRVDVDSPVTNFPAPVTRLHWPNGGGGAIARLRVRLPSRDPDRNGDIGKTSPALKAARGVVGDFAYGGWLVELAQLSDPLLVPSVA